MKRFFYIIFYLIFTNIIYSQPIVVSEYKDQTPEGEWTELLVIQDMLDIVGFTIRDNSDNASWQPSVRFKDHRLWRNLRSGTIIVINHRGGVIDDDKSDGYIEIGRDASEYLEAYWDRPNDGSDPSLSLNANHDMIQIRDANGNHIHLLAHLNPSRINDVFNGVPNPKVGVPSAAARSVRVYPGSSLSDYNKGLDNNFALTDFSESKGLPNGDNQGRNTNHQFWRKLREPSWNNPLSLNAEISQDYKSVKLTWNPASNIKDPNEGYLIVRFISNLNQPLELQDGIIYKPGDNIGIYTVIDTLPDLTNNEYIDKFRFGTFECGTKYAYRIYIYRYQESNIPAYKSYDFNPLNARGRSYNETDYLSTSTLIEKSIPPTPIITSNKTDNKFCSNENVIIQANINDVNKYEFIWYDGANELPDKTPSLNVKKAGSYRLVIRDKVSDCKSTSNQIDVTFIDASKSLIRNKLDNFTFSKDTIINLCINETIKLQGIAIPQSTKNTYQWIRNGNLISNNTDIDISDIGLYRFIVVTDNICSDTSIKIEVRLNNPDYELSASELYFNFDSNPEQFLTITNKGNEQLVFYPNNIIINPPGEFVIINPSITNNNPLIIPPNDSKIITIRYQSLEFGTKKAKLIFRAICNIVRSCELNGIRENTGSSKLLSEPSSGLNFGLIPLNCDELSLKDLQLIVSGPKALEVKLLEMTNNYFDITTENLIVNTITILNSNFIEKLYIKIKVNNIGIYRDTIKVAFRNLGNNDLFDTLKIPVEAEIFVPEFTPNNIILDFSDLPKCITSIDTNLTLNLKPNYAFNVIKNFKSNDLIIKDQLPISFNNSMNLNIKINFNDKVNIFDTLFFSPCNYFIPIEIKSPNFVIEHDKIAQLNYGSINNCEFPSTVEKEIHLKTNYNLKVNKIQNNKDFNLIITNDSILTKGNNKLKIQLINNKAGLYNDSLILYFEPCDDSIKIYLYAERNDLKNATFSKKAIDFGTNYQNIETIEELELFNENINENIEIQSIILPNNVALIKPSSLDFPLIIKPNEKYKIEISYLRTNIGKLSDSITFNIIKPCIVKQTIPIKGESIEKSTFIINLDILKELTVELNKNFNYPINLNFDNNFESDKAVINRFKFDVTYDKNIFEFKDLKIKSNNLVLNNISHLSDKINIDLNIVNPNNFTEGNIVDLDFLSLLGIKLRSNIKVHNFKYFAKSKIETNDDSSLVTITGDCNIYNRTLIVDGQPYIKILSSNPVINDLIIFEISIISNEISKIEMFNYLGEQLEIILNNELKPGIYEIVYNTKYLSNGNYFISFTNGNFKKILPIIISK